VYGSIDCLLHTHAYCSNQWRCPGLLGMSIFCCLILASPNPSRSQNRNRKQFKPPSEKGELLLLTPPTHTEPLRLIIVMVEILGIGIDFSPPKEESGGRTLHKLLPLTSYGRWIVLWRGQVQSIAGIFMVATWPFADRWLFEYFLSRKRVSFPCASLKSDRFKSFEGCPK